MAYLGKEYHGSGAFVDNDVIVKSIPVRNPKVGLTSIFVKISSGVAASLAVVESIDGVEFSTTETALAAYKGSTEWCVVTFDRHAAVPNFPAGTHLRLVAAGAVTVEEIRVVQDW